MICAHWYETGDHAWVKMPWKDAYPASCGIECLACSRTKLYWFTGDLTLEEMIKQLTPETYANEFAEDSG